MIRVAVKGLDANNGKTHKPDVGEGCSGFLPKVFSKQKTIH
jgi:hypothetical protein